MTPPKSILRKSIDMPKPIQRVKFRKRTERSVYSVTTHAHARTAVARITQRMCGTRRTCTHSRRVAILTKAASAFFAGAASSLFPSSLRKMAEEGGRKMATGARTCGEPSGAHWGHRAEARDTSGGPGRYTNTGHGAAVVACKSHSSNIVDVLIVLLTRPRPSSTTLATPSQTLLTASRCSSSLLRTGLRNSTGRNSRRRWMLRKPISWRLRTVSALTAVVDVAAFSSAEKQELVGLVQSRQASDIDDSELSAPAAAVYVSHSSDFVDVLNDLLDKAQTLLNVTRHAESNAAHNFALPQTVP